MNIPFLKQPPKFDAFLISKGLSVQGKMESKGSGRIEGKVFGDARVQGKLILDVKAEIHGNVVATEAMILGVVHGSVVCGRHVELGAQAVVTGDVIAYSMAISPQAQIKGGLIKREKPMELENIVVGAPHSPEEKPGEAVVVKFAPIPVKRTLESDDSTWW